MHNTSNVRFQRTQLRVEGDLVGLVRPIAETLRAFGTVRRPYRDKQNAATYFVVEHTARPEDLVTSILSFAHKGVNHVEIESSTTLLGV